MIFLSQLVKKVMERMENKATTYSLCFIMLFVFCYYSSTYANIIFNPFVSEFREGHTLTPTYLFLKDIMPWSLETYPEYYNSYGFSFNLVVYPFALLFGNSLVLHRIINELFLLMTVIGIVYYKMPKVIDVSRTIILLSLYVLINYSVNITLRPDGLGTFLFTMSILIPLRDHYSGKALCMAAVLSILAFYTKSYFLLGWYLVSFTYLFINCKKCLWYNLFFHSILLISFVVVFKMFPLYFYETIFSYDSSTGKAVDLSFSILQFFAFLIKLTPLLLIGWVIICKSDIKRNRDLLIMITLCIIPLLYPLGTNRGAFVTYHIQLMLPLIGVFLLTCIDSRKVRIPNLFILLALLLLITFNRCPVPGTICKSKDWNKVVEYIKVNNSILNSSLIAPLLMTMDKKCVDNGVAGFVFSFSSSKLTNSLFGLDKEVLTQKQRYVTEIKQNVENQFYDIILLTESEKHLLQYVDDKKYRKAEELHLDVYDGRRYLHDYKMYVMKPIKN